MEVRLIQLLTSDYTGNLSSQDVEQSIFNEIKWARLRTYHLCSFA